MAAQDQNKSEKSADSRELMSDSGAEFQVIFSTMRSGSSLCGHLLAEAGFVRYAGETHSNLSHEKGLQEARKTILKKGIGTNSEAPLCDKVVEFSSIPDGGRFLIRNASRIHVLLRHPLGVWRSGREVNWSFFQLKDLANQYRRLREIVEYTPRSKLNVISYYDLTSSEGRRRIFGKAVDGYGLSQNTGKPGWGDPGELIRTGQIREITMVEDLGRALRSVWYDLKNPELIRAMQEYRAILDWIGRQDLDPPLPEDAFDEVEGLQVCQRKKEGSQKILRISGAEFSKNQALPLQDEVFQWINVRSLVEHLKPERLKEAMREIYRVLADGGKLSLTTPDLGFLEELLNSREEESAEWYRERYFQNQELLPGKAQVLNHFRSRSGIAWLYDQETLEEILRLTGFREIQMVPVEWEVSELESANGFQPRECFSMEALK